jgi:hypothetical protein
MSSANLNHLVFGDGLWESRQGILHPDHRRDMEHTNEHFPKNSFFASVNPGLLLTANGHPMNENVQHI